MNRELKFRIWDNHTNRFVTCVYETNKDCYLFIGRSGYVTAFNCYGEEIDFQDGRFIVQQYVGAEDKNGVSIYEGDIVKYYFDDPRADFVDLVAWEHYGWRLLHFDGTESSSWPFTPLPSMEIIGNIFENKELINL